MRRAVSLVAAALLLAGQAHTVGAATQNFTVSATIPVSNTVNITASRVDPNTLNFTAVNGTTLSFDPMNFNGQFGTFLPDHFFAIDVGVVGAGSQDVTVSYAEGANPNNPGHGLGWKSTATFMKVAGTNETPLASHGPKRMLKDLALAAEHILPAELTGAFLRIYLGIVTKDPTADFPDPAASELFTAGDKPGNYSGTLTITSTVS